MPSGHPPTLFPYLFARKSPQLGGFCLRLRVNVTQWKVNCPKNYTLLLHLNVLPILQDLYAYEPMLFIQVTNVCPTNILLMTKFFTDIWQFLATQRIFIEPPSVHSSSLKRSWLDLFVDGHEIKCIFLCVHIA